MRYLSSFILFFGLSFNVCFAQRMRKVSNDITAKSNYPLNITIQPIFLYNSAFKIDAELQQKEKKSA